VCVYPTLARDRELPDAGRPAGAVGQLLHGQVAQAEPAGKFRGKLVLFGVQKADPANPQLFEAHQSIVAMNPDGTKIETVFTTPPQKLIPAGRIAPDGSRLAFNLQAPDSKQWELWLLDKSGQARKLADDTEVKTWSPDGKKLLCCRSKDNGKHNKDWTSFFLDLDKLMEEPLPLPRTDWAEDWSPDGKWLSVTSYPDKHLDRPSGPYPLRQVYLLGLDGKKGPKLSTDPMHDDLWPRFAPNGQHLAFGQRRHENGKIFYSLMVAGSDGRGAKELVSLNKLAEGRDYDDMRGNGPPCWSPDGKTIALLANGGKGYGTPQMKLTTELIFASPEQGFLRRVVLDDLGIRFAGKVDWR